MVVKEALVIVDEGAIGFTEALLMMEVGRCDRLTNSVFFRILLTTEYKASDFIQGIYGYFDDYPRMMGTHADFKVHLNLTLFLWGKCFPQPIRTNHRSNGIDRLFTSNFFTQ